MKTLKTALIVAAALTFGMTSLGFAETCSNKSGTAFSRKECRKAETEVVGALDVCEMKSSGKLLLRDGCKKSEITVGRGTLYAPQVTALRLGSGGGSHRNGFTCSEGVCDCDGDADCNEMFESGVCDGKQAECVEDTVPHFCYCGGTVSNPNQGPGGSGPKRDPRLGFPGKLLEGPGFLLMR